MRKRTFISLFLMVVMILTASGIASAQDSWEYYFPITVSDNSSTTRTAYPIILEVGGQHLVDTGYMTANGTDARLRTTADKNLMLSSDNIAFVVDSLPAYGQATYNLYTGYSPEIGYFPTIVGDGGYVTVADNTTLELGDNFTIEQGGWWDTSVLGTSENVTINSAWLSHLGLTAWVPAQLVDGNLGSDGFSTSTSGNTSWMMVDFGSGNEQGLVKWEYYVDADFTAIWDIQYSTDNSSWTTAYTGLDCTTGGAEWKSAVWAPVGEYQYWRSAKTDGAVAGDYCIELQVFTGYQRNSIIKPDAFSIHISASENITAEIVGGSSVSATGVSSGEHTVKVAERPVLSFDGNDNAKKSIANWRSGDSAGTLMVWFNTSNATQMALFTSADEAAPNQFFNFSVRATGKIMINTNGPANDAIEGSSNLIDGEWHLATLVSNGTAWTLYKDNAVLETPNVVVGSNSGNWFADIPARDNIIAGALETNAGLSQYYDGKEAGILIYSKALTPSEIQDVYIGEVSTVDLVGYWKCSDGSGAVVNDSSTSDDNLNITGASWGNYLLEMLIDDELEVQGDGAAVPNNANDWTFLQNNVMPYADNITISVNGTQQLWFEPNEMITGTTLPDRATSVANDGTITWGSNDQVTIVFGSVTSYEATVSAATVNTTGFVLPLVGIPDNWWGMEFDGTDLPFYPTFLDTSTQTGIPLQTLYLLMVFGAAIALATVTIVLTRSVVVGVAFYTVTMAYGANAGIVAWWIIYVFLIMVIGIIFLSSRQAMGG